MELFMNELEEGVQVWGFVNQITMVTWTKLESLRIQWNTWIQKIDMRRQNLK